MACCLGRPNSDLYYVGLFKSQVSGTLDYWLDSSSSTYRPYKSGEPDSNDLRCYAIKGDTGELEDYDCSNSEKYICKRASS